MHFDQLKLLSYNGQIAVDGRDVFLAGSNTELNREKAVFGTLSVAGMKLTFTKADVGGTGAWIPYVAQANVWGYLRPGQTWAASGPYSGCLFEVGIHADKIYAAHLSRESSTDRNIAAWGNVLEGKRVLFSKKIGVFVPGTLVGGTAAITVASIAGQSVTVSRLDVVTANVGSMNGRIMGVTPLTSD